LLGRLEQVVAPLDRRPQRSLSLGRVPASSRQQRQPPLQTFEHGCRREHLDACRCELEGKRQAVEPAAELVDVLVGSHGRFDRVSTFPKENRRIDLWQWCDLELDLASDPERLAARHEQPETRTGSEQPGELGRALDRLLEVVEEKQHRAIADVLGELDLRTDRLRDRREHEGGVANRRQRYPPDPAREVVDRFGCDLHRQAGLAYPSGADKRYEAMLAEQRSCRGRLVFSPDQPCRLDRQVRLVQRLEPRVLLLAELVELLGLGEILEPVRAERAEVDAVEQAGGRLSDDDLAPVRGRADPGGPMDVQTHVSLCGDGCLARVDSHAHPNRSAREHPLPCLRRCDRIRSARKGDEECIALRVHLNPAVGCERLPEQAAVLRQGRRICVAELTEELRRAFDVVRLGKRVLA